MTRLSPFWIFVGLMLTSLACSAQPRYRLVGGVELVGNSQGAPTLCNDRGQFVYSVPRPGGPSQWWFFTGNESIDLGSRVFPTGLNNDGQIVGLLTDDGDGGGSFIFRNNITQTLGQFGTRKVGGVIGIDDNGVMLGWRTEGSRRVGVLDRDGAATDMGSIGGSFVYPTAIHARGGVTGYASVVDFSPPHAFLYQGGTMRDLGTGPGVGSAGKAINARGDVAGYVDYPKGIRHAMVWRDGVMRDIGSLGGPFAQALGINQDGIVVGSSYSNERGGVHGFVYRHGIMLDLNDLVVLPTGGESIIQAAIAINERGEILCHGVLAGVSRSFLLIPEPGSAQVVNVSFRAQTGSGERTLIVGVTEDAPAGQVLIRGAGPALARFGIPNPMPDPRVEVMRDGVPWAGNNDWSANGRESLSRAFAQTGAFPFANESRDAALTTALPKGAATIHLAAELDAGGAGLLELYPMDDGAFIANASARAFVSRAGGPLIGGFVVAGGAPQAVVIRAAGPGLARFGVSGFLADPVLTLYAGGRAIATNGAWGSLAAEGQLSTGMQISGAFPFAEGSKDSALLATLPPGAYTVHVESATGGQGVVLCELYFLRP